MEIKLVLSGLNCANCANKIEAKVNKINGVENASLNFSTTVLTVEINKDEEKNNIVNEIKSIVKKLEPHVKVIEKSDNKDIKVNKAGCTSRCCTDGHCHESNNEEHHGHSHTHEFKENNGFLGYVKDNLLLIIGAIVYIIALAYKSNENLLSFILFGVSYLIIGGEVILNAIKNIIRGEIFDENFLMSIATIGAFFIGEYPEAARPT